jgi:hypothetical protein
VKIEEKDFVLEYDKDSNKFDLYLLYVKNAKIPEKRSEEFKLYGYSMTLESCLNKIIHDRLSKRYEVLTLKNYLDEFKKESVLLREITKIL